MNKIDIYTTSTCPFCIKAKKLLSTLELNYIEHNVDNSFNEMTRELSERFNKSIATVPQIIINEKYVGGFTDLEALYKSGKLNEYLEK